MQPTSETDLLTIEDLRVSFMLQTGADKHWTEVVKGVSLRLKRGRTLALVGESGSGKSVISQAVMGILPRNGKISGGRVLFADKSETPGQPDPPVLDLAQMDRDDPAFRALRGDRIGMIFQEPMSSLSPVHSIGNQIAESVRLHRPDFRGKERAKTENMLGLVGFRNPHAAFDQFSFELSGGLRQRAMLAMALICNPALLIADEPTTALDVTVQAQILKLMLDLQREIGMSMLLITHDLGVVANVANDVAVIYHGQIMEAGTVEDIFRSPAHPYVKALMKATPHFDMADGERLVSLREVKRSLGTMAGVAARPKLEASATPLISVRNLKKSYGRVEAGWLRSAQPGFVAVDNVSFDIARGECLGLVGESGCGKTTVSKILMRAITPDSGSVTYDDGATQTEVLDLQGRDLRHFRQRIQMIFQDPVSSLSPRMTVANILREPLDIQNIGEPGNRLDRVRELLTAVGLDPRFLNRYPHSFSGGQRQRIGIARALALQPDLIVCDEAVSALDVSVQAQVLNLLKDLQADLGLTYLFISHNLAVVGYIADRIAVMARGKIVEIAPRHVLFRQPAHPYTKILLKSVPFTDLDQPLDLEATTRMSPSDPAFWPKAFQPDASGGGLELLDLGNGHQVLANALIDQRELVA